MNSKNQNALGARGGTLQTSIETIWLSTRAELKKWVKTATTLLRITKQVGQNGPAINGG